VGYDNDREMHTLELLKLRFGEASLHKCEVMLKAGGLLRTALVLFR
jgi:anaphase-promoting complex subunit 2